MIVLTLSGLLLNACSYSVQVLPTPSLVAPSITPGMIISTATPTYIPATLVAPSATPTLISIRANTIALLEIFGSIEGGETPRSLAFTPDGTVLAVAGGNAEDFAIRLWDVASGQSIGTLDQHTGIV